MNHPLLQQAREAALHFLKPSQRDLDYGLSLHRESLVIESYSLGLRAPLDLAAYQQAAEAGASSDELATLHTEHAVTGWLRSQELRDELHELRQFAGVTASFQNAGEEGNDIPRLLQRLAFYTAVTDELPAISMRAPSPSAIEEAHQAGKHALIFSSNGVPLPSGQPSVAESLHYIRLFAYLGVRMMHLTYNRRNLLGDGCAESADAGLSDFGRHAVHEMNKAGIIIDLAHTGWQTTIDTANHSRHPVVISHSALHALQPHIRTKPDNVIRAVVEKGGTIGITNVPGFLGGDGTIVSFLNHIEQAVKTYGDDAVTIGTDSSFPSRHALAAAKSAPPFPKKRPSWEALWPTGTFPIHPAKDRLHPEQLTSLEWTNWPLFTVGLVQRGFSDATIRKIIGGNIMRLFKHVHSERSIHSC